MAIVSFSDKQTEVFYVEEKVPKGVGWASCSRVALRKLTILNGATVLLDLASPPGSRLEALKCDLAGSHSIRINDQWRIVFRWTDKGPAHVRIADYH